MERNLKDRIFVPHDISDPFFGEDKVMGNITLIHFYKEKEI